ncbi:putative hydroxypyruvate isomerase isoform 2-T2 [Dama dama]|uniref:putative hydroxypyruvate isomerase isoform X2 n=1 Tax=Dama dama TaxID=30532 RepID=UPI002A36228C|nr:putative hydroxypyruvate isomerase isoform X2 [Dama dama]
MAPLRFSANLSWLFPELSGFPARLRAAGSSGFEAAEIGWPYAEPPEALARAAREAGLRVVLINTPPGDREKGENGLGAVPGRQAAFREGLEQAVLYAKALGCSRIHLMAGRVPKGADRAVVRGEMETVFLENLRHAAEVLAQENLVGLLEPINTRITDPRYFLDTPQQAAAILQKVGRPNLQLQMVSGGEEGLLKGPVFSKSRDSGAGCRVSDGGNLLQDLFHWQIMDGNLTGNVREFMPIVGEAPFLASSWSAMRFPLSFHSSHPLHLPPEHVQVAQVPGRGEPDSPGELNFSYLFQLLEDEGYTGFVGCEYQPRGDTVEGLSWLRSYWEMRGRPQAGQ